MLVLHYHPTSPYSRKAAVGIRLRKDPVELRLLDVPGGAHRSPAFRERSPFGKMPVLETPEGTWFESTTILEWLEHRGPPLLIPPEHAVLARHWDRVGDLYLLEPQSVLFFGGDEAAARATADVALGLLERQLADGRAFVCGERPTLADLSTSIGCDQLDLLGHPLPGHVSRWLERMRALPELAEQRSLGMPLTEALLARRRARAS